MSGRTTVFRTQWGYNSPLLFYATGMQASQSQTIYAQYIVTVMQGQYMVWFRCNTLQCNLILHPVLKLIRA